MTPNRSSLAIPRTLLWAAIAVVALISGVQSSQAQTISASDSSGFTPVVKSNGTIMTDPFNDQQTGQPQADFISFTAGTSIYTNGGSTAAAAPADVPGFLIKTGQIAGDTTNTYVMFRFRFQDGNQNKSYEGSYVMLGVDLNQDGKPDIIFGVDATGSTAKLDFLKPGILANDSPSTTSAASYTTTASLTLNSSTVNYQVAGTNYDVVAGSKVKNMYLTFGISYANLQQAIRDMGTVNGTNFSTFVVNSSTPMNFLAYSSQQDNAFNQDLYGGSFTSSSSATWTSLGAFSTTFSGSGSFTITPTPELGTMLQTSLLVVVGGGLYVWRRRGTRRVIACAAT